MQEQSSKSFSRIEREGINKVHNDAWFRLSVNPM